MEHALVSEGASRRVTGVRRRARGVMAGLVGAAALSTSVLIGAGPSKAIVPGINGRIAFETSSIGNNEIFTMNPDGSDPINLTNNAASDVFPAWSPSATKLTFSSNRVAAGNAEVYVMNADGTGVTQLTDAVGEDRGTSWTSDSQKIVFHSARDTVSPHAFDVFTMNPDGTNQTMIISNASAAYVCGDSTTGKIVYNSAADPLGTNPLNPAPVPGDPPVADFEIFTANMTGGNIVQVTNNTVLDSGPKWSPDCSTISYNSLDSGGSLDVFRINANGTGNVNLTNAPGVFDAFSAWSPDGARIVFSTNRDGQFELYTMDSANGANLARLTTTTTGGNLRADWGTRQVQGSIPDVSVTEGDRGTSNATFTVTLTAASTSTITIAYATADGTATAPADYTSTSGTLTFAPGQTTKTIVVPVKGDGTDEANETFFVNLTNPANLGAFDAQAVGTIIDDDAGPGYWLAAADGGIFAFDAPFAGSTGNLKLNKPIVGMAADPDGVGYWLVASDGGIFAFDAPFFGSTGALTLNKPIVGMAATPDGKGYYLVASDGGVFAFGSAAFKGSTGAITLNKPMVGMAADGDGSGYWLVASDGGIFAFDAVFKGSTGAIALNKPIVGMAADPDDSGYWLVASDGGIFAFDAVFKGSTGAIALNKPIVGMAADPDGSGYWLVASDGGIFAFDAVFKGSTGALKLNQPVVAMAART